MSLPDLKKKREELSKNFDDFEKQVEKLVEQRREIDQTISSIREEQVRLQGAYNIVEEMLNPPEKEEKKKKEEKPKEKK